MAKTVIGLFENVFEAQHVLQDLVAHRFDHDGISVIAHQERAAALESAASGAPRRFTVSGLGPVLATGPLTATRPRLQM
jgi:hypothetical protein